MSEQPSGRHAPIRAADPRARVVAAVLAACCLAPLRDPAACWAGLILGILSLLLSRPPLETLLRRLAAVNAFILLLWCVTPWSTPGEAVAQWGGFAVTAEGLRLSLITTLKANALLLLFLSLVAEMDVSALGHALDRLGCPARLVLLLLLTGRHIHLLADEWAALRDAARLRGFQPRTDARTYRTLASLLGLLLVRAHDRSIRAHEAMLLRGFSGRFRSAAELRAGPADALLLLGLICCLAGILLLEHGVLHV